ncbi:MFS transporter [Pelomonas sp. KK5]|uniref:MFS transporter n=1 Tax=Pelomonas sp. KK5 TaxID=1855730 RepID=UPI00097C8325|nr:MFS transporter [Pelomonas sp. KK5]
MRVALICFLAIVCDGLDVSLFGTLLPAIMKDMKMNPADAGLLASAGHVGAVGGSILFGMAADAIGRKRMLLVGVTLFVVFTAACGLARGFGDFMAYRLIAGIGLAGIVPIAVALVFEHAPGPRKAMVSSMAYMGIAVGVLLSATLAMALLPTMGWRAILTGTFACIVLVPVIMLWIPESRAMPGKAPVVKVPLARLFQGGHARNTVLLGTALFCLMLISVTLTTWIAQLMLQRGFSMTTGISFILVFSLANFISTPLAGWMADRMGYRQVFGLYMPILFVSISLIGVVPNSTAALACMFCAGFGAMGTTCLLLPYVGSLYPPAFRSSAMGVIYGIGRTGPIVGPAIVGLMLAAGASLPLILIGIAAPSLVALIAFVLVRPVPTSLESLESNQ